MYYERKYTFAARKQAYPSIAPFRNLFLQEMAAQIRYDACHSRGWADEYILSIDHISVGYGSIKGKDHLTERDAIFEWFIIPGYRKYSSLLFEKLLLSSGAGFIECQTNDKVLSHLLYEFANQIYSDVILFMDAATTQFYLPDTIFRKRSKQDVLWNKDQKDYGSFVLERKGEIVADGGFLSHYNAPFSDLYMEVNPLYHRQGLGSYILQEVKKECYKAGRFPSARCNMDNKASKATLIKAGFHVCGHMLTGKIKK